MILASVTVLLVVLWLIGSRPVRKETAGIPDYVLVTLSERLLYAVKTEDQTDSLEQVLANYSFEKIVAGLTNDTARKLFWINLYNAWYQILAIRDKKTQPSIFTEMAIHFADFSLSLDDIEHGILRKYRWKYSLGYLPQLFPSFKIKQLAVDNIDYRIHFALNCGAKSCPPIAFYRYEELEIQLDLAAQSFLANETVSYVDKREVQVTKIMYWFLADFGGKSGIRKILSKYLRQDFEGYKISFKDYDWSADLKNFSE